MHNLRSVLLIGTCVLLASTGIASADQYVPKWVEQAALAEMEFDEDIEASRSFAAAAAETEKSYCLVNDTVYLVHTNWGQKKLGFHFTSTLAVTKQMILCQKNKAGKIIFTPWVNGKSMSALDEAAVKALWNKEGGKFSCRDGINRAARYSDGGYAYKTATPTGKMPEFEVPLQ